MHPPRSTSQTASPTSGLDAFTVGKQILVMALRKRSEGPGVLVALQGVFLLLCGLANRESAMLGFEGVYHLLSLRGRRPIRILEQTDLEISAHEQATINLLAALQADDTARARALACWLVPASLTDDLLRHADRLAHAMSRHDRRLPVREHRAVPLADVPGVTASLGTRLRPEVCSAR